MTASSPLRSIWRKHAQALRLRIQQSQRRGHATKPEETKPRAARTEEEIPTPNNVPTLPFWQRLGPFTRAGQAYARNQRRRPLTTQFCSSLVIFLAGDISAQKIGGREYDPVRTGRAVLIGAISSIPSYKWYVDQV